MSNIQAMTYEQLVSEFLNNVQKKVEEETHLQKRTITLNGDDNTVEQFTVGGMYDFFLQYYEKCVKKDQNYDDNDWADDLRSFANDQSITDLNSLVTAYVTDTYDFLVLFNERLDASHKAICDLEESMKDALRKRNLCV
jgi:hypothetical protein